MFWQVGLGFCKTKVNYNICFCFKILPSNIVQDAENEILKSGLGILFCTASSSSKSNLQARQLTQPGWFNLSECSELRMKSPKCRKACVWHPLKTINNTWVWLKVLKGVRLWWFSYWLFMTENANNRVWARQLLCCLLNLRTWETGEWEKACLHYERGFRNYETEDLEWW